MNEVINVDTIVPILAALGIGAALMYFYLKQNLKPPTNTCENDFTDAESKIIPAIQAQLMFDEYTKHRVSAISSYEASRSRVNFAPTRYGSHTFKTMGNYFDLLDCVDKLLKETNAYPNGIVGVRYYFAKYPNRRTYDVGSIATKFVAEEALESGEKASDYQGRNTFFIVPVIESKVPSESSSAIEVPFLFKKVAGSIEIQELTNFLVINTDNSQKQSQEKSLLEDGIIDPSFKSTIFNEAGLTPPPF